jgi:hypothetical protein
MVAPFRHGGDGDHPQVDGRSPWGPKRRGARSLHASLAPVQPLPEKGKLGRLASRLQMQPSRLGFPRPDPLDRLLPVDTTMATLDQPGLSRRLCP